MKKRNNDNVGGTRCYDDSDACNDWCRPPSGVRGTIHILALAQSFVLRTLHLIVIFRQSSSAQPSMVASTGTSLGLRIVGVILQRIDASEEKSFVNLGCWLVVLHAQLAELSGAARSIDCAIFKGWVAPQTLHVVIQISGDDTKS